MQVDVEQSVEVASDRAEGDGCFAPSSLCGDKPYLIVDNSDLPATAHELRDVSPDPETSSIGMARYRLYLAVTAVPSLHVG
jgi:hypothetical protein